MANNSLLDLNDHLFAQMERLSNPSLTGEQLDDELRRAEAMVAVSDQIVGNADTMLKAAKIYAEHGDKTLKMLPQVARAKPHQGVTE